MNSFYLLLELALPADSPSCERLQFFALPSFQEMKMMLDRLFGSCLISLVPEFPAFEAQETWLIYLGLQPENYRHFLGLLAHIRSFLI
jgi:hypothetical protein